MPGWDIEDEENPGSSGVKEQETVGAEDYMIVLHYPRLRPAHFKPQHIEKDSDGRQMVNPFCKTAPKLEEGDPETVYRKMTHSWKTSKNDLDMLETDAKSFCNSVKAFLNKHKVAVFFHNSARDECAMYQGPHLHILYHSELTSSGQFQALWQRTEWITMTKKAKAAGGYCRCQAVKHLEGAVKHFNSAPRLLLGTSYIEYGKILMKCKQNKIASVMVSELFEGDQEGSPMEECEFGDFEESGKPSAKRPREDFAEEEPGFILTPAAKGPVKVKESEKDALNRLVTILCNRWLAWTGKELFRKAGELYDIPSEEKYRALWYRLSTKSGIDMVIKNVRDKAESLTMYKPFAQLINEYCQDVVEEYGGRDGRLDPKESYQKMLAWLEWQHIDPVSFVNNVFDVMDRVNPKINCITLIGAPNSGKTTMVSAPIREICKHVGQIGNRGANSDFIYQECLNKRMIALDECVMAPQCLEDLKLLTAGEKLKSNCKSKGFEDVVRTPCILTGNKEPWVLDVEAEGAFMTRMLKYTVTTCPELESIRGLSPKMWWYLMQIKVLGDVNAVKFLALDHPGVTDADMSEDDLN